MTASLQYLILTVNLLLVALVAVVLYLIKKENDNLNKGGIPNQKILKEALLKSDSIIGRAINKAQDIVSVAQSKRLNLVAAEKLLSTKIVDSYRTDIEKLENEIQQKFEKNTLEADKVYKEFLASIENKITASLTANQKILDQKATEFIDTAGKSLTEYTQELESRIKNQIEGEMQKANGEIEEYKIHRRKVLDEKIRIELQIIKKEKPLIVGDTENITLELFKKGKSVPEIAYGRNLAFSTIFEHMRRLVANGYVSSSEFVEDDKINKILEAVGKLKKHFMLREIKEILPDDITYDEIKCVLADKLLKHKKIINE